jgi:hypothetical protein
VLHSGRLQPYPQSLHRLERLARDKHSNLSPKFVNYGQKKFYNIGPWFHPVLSTIYHNYQIRVGCENANLFAIRSLIQDQTDRFNRRLRNVAKELSTVRRRANVTNGFDRQNLEKRHFLNCYSSFAYSLAREYLLMSDSQ